MIQRTPKPCGSRSISGLASLLLFAPAAFAADGTWTNAAGGSWSTDTNWSGNTIADGAGFTADFSTLDITADGTVTLDGARTIGNLVFGDVDTVSAAGWIINTGTSGPLTLAGTSPTITVNTLGTGKNVTFGAVLDGTDGFTKGGLGTLVLSQANTFTGGITLNGGTLNYGNAAALSSGPITYTAGTILQAGLATTLANPISVATGITGTVGTSGFDTTLSGAITGDGILAKGGGAVLTLTGGLANTIAGGIQIASGRLNVVDGLSLTNTGPVTVNSGGALNYSKNFAAGNNLTNDITLSGPGTGVFGALNLQGNVTATGAITLADDATISHNFNNATISGAITGTDRSLTLATTQNGQPGMVVSGPVSLGTGGITVTGADNSGGFSVRLSGSNTYTGGTTLTAGTLNFADAGALGSGAVSFTGDSTLQAGIATTLANAVSVDSGVTATVDTNGNTTTLGGVITGDGGLTKTGAGTLIISGGAAGNTLSGAINVNAGTLAIDDVNPNPAIQSLANMNGDITVASGATFDFSQSFQPEPLDNNITISGPGVGPKGALHIWRNATATGTITLAADATITHTFNRGIIDGSIIGTDHNLTLTTLTDNQPGLEVNGPIQLGAGGITVNGAANNFGGGDFSVKLSGANSYSGETHVVTGKLTLTGDSRINDSSTVRIDSGAILELDFSGTDTVGTLFLPGDPNPKPDGTYGSLASTADNKSADFEGAGILEVGGATDNFAAWAASQVPPVTGGPDGDDNNNGVPNLIEYALVDGGERGVFSGNTITFTKRGAPYGGDITYGIETSTDLGITDPWDTPGSGVTEDATSISFTFTPGSPVRNFARLKVVQTSP